MSRELLTIEDGFRVLLKWVPTTIGVLGDAVATGWTTFWLSVRSLDVLGALNAGLTAMARMELAPLLGLIRSLGEVLTENAVRYRSVVITGEDVVKLIIRLQEQAYLETSFLKNSTIQDIILDRVALIVWNMITRSGPVFSLIRLKDVNSAADLARIFKQSALKAVWLRLAAIVVAFMALGAAIITLVVLGTNYEAWIQEFQLRQNSRRKFQKKAGWFRPAGP